MNTETIECAHDICQCMVTSRISDTFDPAEAFCSEDCRAADNDEETEVCACGHSPCDTP